MKNIVLIVGTRPNFIKAAPVYHSLNSLGLYNLTVLHTGQHYDWELDESICRDVMLPITFNIATSLSDRWLLINSIEPVLLKYNPDMVIIFGDVNSTFAGAWVAKKHGILLAHVESGGRSDNWKMEEEFNRYFVDSISDILFTIEEQHTHNINKEFNNKKVYYVGNTMIDSLYKFRHLIMKPIIEKPYAVITLHRRENIVEKRDLEKVISIIEKINKKIPIKLFAHPHLVKQLKRNNLNVDYKPPLPYIEFMNVVYNSKFVFTDSGGLQTEAAYMQIPCIVYRKHTEHIISHRLHSHNTQCTIDIMRNVNNILNNTKEKGICPILSSCNWGDGKASERITKTIKEALND